MFTEDLLSNAKRPICVVGNSTFKHKFGRIIDEYGTVIRMNNFKVLGFQDYVGTKTDYRCVSGWEDVENRNEHIEFSPFTDYAKESLNLKKYNQNNSCEVITARNDVKLFIKEVDNPSTGFALVQLLNLLNVPVDLFGFDGFRTGHYWDKDKKPFTTHFFGELSYVLKRSNVVLYNILHDYNEICDYCREQHDRYYRNTVLVALNHLNWHTEDKKILEFCVGNSTLSDDPQQVGNKVITEETYGKNKCYKKISNEVLELVFLNESYDIFISFDVLEYLHENDIKILVRQISQLCKEFIISVSARPNKLLDPSNEDPRLTVRPIEWWKSMFGQFFDIRLHDEIFDNQFVMTGQKRLTEGSTKLIQNNTPFRVIALVSAYNEEDIIYHVIGALIQDGIEVYLINHNSDDNTVREASKWLNRGLIHIENFPEDAGYPERNETKYIWSDILRRKEELALELEADWFIHHDADEFRESPWLGLSLREAIEAVEKMRYSAIDFELFNFRPVDNNFIPGEDVRQYLKYYDEGGEFDKVQVKAWKKQNNKIDLITSGGHEAKFEGRRVMPIKFILRHYPIRSQQHGIRKVFKERKPKFIEEEKNLIWHVQYDSINDEEYIFLSDPSKLNLYDGEEVRLRLLSVPYHSVLPGLLPEERRAKDDHIQNLEVRLNNLEETLNSIYVSKGWKLLKTYYNIRDILLRRRNKNE
jgi:hypothetical protein